MATRRMSFLVDVAILLLVTEVKSQDGGNPSGCQAPLDVCLEPANPGPCKESLQRWYYNGTTKQCVSFVYGGCEGNGNNFLSKALCDRRCSIDSNFMRAVCKRPAVTGSCNARMVRWYYNSTEGDCKEFNFGGCDGNLNNFASQKQCQERCNRNPKVTILKKLKKIA